MFRGSGDDFRVSSWPDSRVGSNRTFWACHIIEQMFYHRWSAMTAYAELHCHTNFSFLDGASAPDELVERAVELGLTGLAVTDHQGLYGVVRFDRRRRRPGSVRSSGSRSSCSTRSSPDPDRVVVPAPASRRRGRRRRSPGSPDAARPESARARPVEGRPDRPRPERARLPGSSRGGQGGPARDRRAAARPAPRPARPGRDRLSQPVPARLAGEPGRDEGDAALHPGAARRAHRGPRRPVGLPRRRDRAAAAGRRPRRGAGRGSRLRRAATAGAAATASTSSCRITSCPTTTGS